MIKKINQIKAGALLSYTSMVLSYVIMIVYTPIMLRLLGRSEYGLYNLVASVVGYLGLLSFGFGSAYMRYYSRYKVKNENENIAKLNGMFIVIYSIIALLALLAGFILVNNTEIIFGDKLTKDELDTASILMSILVFNIALNFPASVFMSHITANERYIFQKSIQMIKLVLNPFIMLPVLLMGYKSIGLVVVTTLLNITVEIINTFYCLKILKMKFKFSHFDLGLLKEMTIFSSYIFMNIIVDQVNWNVGKFILGRYNGTIAVAVYGLAAQLNTYYLHLSTVISSVFIPRVNRLVAAGETDKQLTHLFTRIGRIQFIMLTCLGLGLIFFGKPFIILWAGKDYEGSFNIALILILTVTVPLIQNIGIEIQRAKNMHKFRSTIYFLIAIFNICISIPLTKYYGGIGTAIGTAGSLIIGNGIIMNWYYHKKVGINIIYFWNNIIKILPALLIPALFGFLISYNFNLNKPINFVSYSFFYLVVFIISVWKLGMNSYEKELISVPLKNIIKKIRKHDR